jgi:VWFA-related protein
VEGLSAADFRVTDNGQPQPILHFDAQERPLDVILLVDISGSMVPVVERIAGTAHRALAELRAGDRVAVMAFSDRTVLAEDFTGDLALIERRLNRLLNARFVNETQLQKAIDDAALHFLREPASGRRRAVLAITDNVGTDRTQGALEHLWQADAVLSGLIITPPGQGPAPSFARLAGLNTIAEQSGGDTFNASDAGAGFRDMMRRLRLRYSLDYALPNATAGERRTIQVQLTGEAAGRHAGAAIRARTGYVAPAR